MANMTKTTKTKKAPAAPVTTWADLLAATRYELVTAFNAFLSMVVAIQNDWFHERGGCDNCGGVGGTMEHYTLDYIHGEWTECSKCGGKDKGRVQGFVRLSGNLSNNVELIGDWMRFMKSELLETYDEYRDALVRVGIMEREDEENRRIAVGKRVRVVKGRKVPIGTEGFCIWVASPYHTTDRIGVKDDTGAVHWTNRDNCEVIKATGEQRARFEQEREAYRLKRALERTQEVRR